MYVYILKTASGKERHYVGISGDPDARLEDHNAGRSPHTSKWRPWVLIAKSWFADEQKALAFERYLKTGSGRAFCKRHFSPSPSRLSGW